MQLNTQMIDVEFPACADQGSFLRRRTGIPPRHDAADLGQVLHRRARNADLELNARRSASDLRACTD